MSIINIAIDTNIFRDNPQKDKPEFKALKKLANNHKIKIYMPYIIEQEFITQQKADCNKINHELIKSLNSLNKRRYTNKEYVEELLTKTQNLNANTKDLIQSEFDTWCEELLIEKRPLNSTHLNTVINDYFQGNNPFKTEKSRKDIPDAFIYQELVDIYNEKGNLTFIVKDNYFRESCKKINIDSYETLDDFIKSSQIQYLLKEHEVTKEKFTELKDFLFNNSDSIESLLSFKYIKELEYQTIDDYSIPSDDNSADIMAVETPEDIKFDYANTKYYGDNNIAIPVNFNVDVTAHFSIFKADYYGHDYGFSVDDLNNHYYSAEDEFTLNVNATIILTLDINSFDFSQSLEQDVFEEVVNFDSIEIDSIDSFEIVHDEKEKHDITFTCKECGKVHNIMNKDLHWDIVSSDERNMGAENQHESIYEDTCEICGNSMHIIFSCWEYPVGAINDTNYEASGIENLKGEATPDLWRHDNIFN